MIIRGVPADLGSTRVSVECIGPDQSLCSCKVGNIHAVASSMCGMFHRAVREQFACSSGIPSGIPTSHDSNSGGMMPISPLQRCHFVSGAVYTIKLTTRCFSASAIGQPFLWWLTNLTSGPAFAALPLKSLATAIAICTASAGSHRRSAAWHHCMSQHTFTKLI